MDKKYTVPIFHKTKVKTVMIYNVLSSFEYTYITKQFTNTKACPVGKVIFHSRIRSSAHMFCMSLRGSREALRELNSIKQLQSCVQFNVRVCFVYLRSRIKFNVIACTRPFFNPTLILVLAK